MKPQLDANDYNACPEYNEWLDDQHKQQAGLLDIFGFQPRPSSVLFSLSPDTYQATFADFQQQRQDELKESVFNDFPSPIAYYFYRFENGYESELQRLHFLRDTWEATCDLLHAITLAECRSRGLLLQDPVTFSHLLTDSMAQRLLNIERIIEQTATAGHCLAVSQIAPAATIGTMRALNQARNAFSHSAAQSETQASNWISECYAEVLGVLDDLRGLGDVEVMRYLDQSDANTLRCEIFKGFGAARTIRKIVISHAQSRDYCRYFFHGQLLALCGDCILSLLPMVHYRQDATGHTTRLCLFRKAHGAAPNRRIEYEVVGEASRWDAERANYSRELSELRGLFGLGPD